MTRGSSIGANDLTRAPHHASYATLVRRDSLFNLPSALPLGATWSHSLGARNESASFHASSALLKLSQFAQAMLDVFAASYWLLYVALWVVVILGVLPFTLFWFLLVKF